MRNVLIIATTSYAGMGPYVSEIVNTFNADDGVCFLFRDYTDNFFYNNVKKELHPLCTFCKQANSNWNKFKALFGEDSGFVRLIISICKEKNIRVVHFLCDPAPVQVSKQLEKLGVSVVGTVHDLHPHEAKKAFHKMIRHRISEKHRWKNTSYGKYLITNSMTQFEELKMMFPNKQIFYHAFPSLVTKAIIEGNAAPLELNDVNKPYIMFFGRIEEYKGLSLLYKAFVSDLYLRDNYLLVIAGKGSVNIEGIAQEKNIILINRYIDDSEVRYLYEKSRCIVYPYLSATQSGVLSLAFYFGKPTLASDIPFFHDIIEPNKAGMLFKMGSSEDLREKLCQMLRTDTGQMEKNAKEAYLTLYDTSTIRERLFEIYKIV